MLRSSILRSSRAFSTSALLNHKVAVLGAGGGIGQPLSLLLKLNDKVTDLALFDIKGAPGVAADLSHIDLSSTVKGFGPDNEGLKKTLEGSDVIVIPAGVPRKPGMTRDDLFNTNASIVRDLAKAAADAAPNAFIAIISNPVNSTVPIFKAVYEKKGVYDPKKLFGVTKLDTVRANKFISEIAGTNPLKDEEALVVGGHSGTTIVPLFSHTQTASEIKAADIDALVNRIQFGGDEVVKAKDGAGSATLSMAHAGAQFVDSLLLALNGEEVDDVAYVDIDTYADKGVSFFAQTLALNADGWEHAYDIEPDEREQKLLDAALPELKKNIQKGEEWIAKNYD